MKSAFHARLRMISFCALTLALLAGCSRRSHQAAQAAVESGRRMMQQGKYADANDEFSRAIKLDSHLMEAYLLLARVQEENADWADAYATLQQADEVEPDRIDIRLAISGLYLSGRQFSLARDEAEAVLAREPKNTIAMQDYGRACMGLQQYGAARDTFSKLVEIDRQDASVFIDKGLAEENLHQYGDAENSFHRAVAADPKSTLAYVSLAKFYRARKQPAQADAALQQGLRAIPGDESLNLLWAQSLQESGNGAQALEVVQRLEAAKGNVPDAAQGIGDFFRSISDLNHALDAYQKGLANAPRSLGLRSRLIELDLDMGRIADAVTVNRQMLQENSRNFTARVLHGRIVIAQGKVDDGAVWLQKLVSGHEDSGPAHFALGLAYQQQGEADQAIAEMEQAVKNSPDMLAAWRQLTELHLARGELHLAQEDGEQCVQSGPADSGCHLALGKVLLHRDEPARARDEFNRSQRLAPLNPWPHLFLARLLAAEKNSLAAEKEFQEALAVAPHNSEIFGDYLQFLQASRQQSSAISRAKQYAAMNPEDAAAHFLLSTVLEHSGQLPEAKAEAQRALQLDPALPAVYLQIGNVAVRMNEADAALAHYGSLPALRPEIPAAPALLGDLYLSKGDLANARKYYEQSLAIDPYFAPAAANLAWVYAQQGEKLDVALTLAQKARILMPDDDTVADKLAWVQYKQGSFSQARLILQDCVQRAPEQADFHYHLGMVLLAAGSPQKAKAELDTALRLKLSDADTQQARQALARLN